MVAPEAQQFGFCSSLASEAALSESHFQAVCAHTSSLTTPSPLSSLLLIVRCHDNHNDTRMGVGGDCLHPLKGVNLFFSFSKMTVNPYIWNSGLSLLRHSECVGPKKLFL